MSKIDKAEQQRADEAAAKGAAYLDGKLPDWEWRIDTSKLHLDDGCRCVLGQLAIDIVPRKTFRECIKRGFRPSFGDAVRTLRLRSGRQRDYGFVETHPTRDMQNSGWEITYVKGTGISYAALTRAWRKLVRQRTKYVS